MINTTWTGSVIELEPRGLEIEESDVIDADPDVIDQLDDVMFVTQR